MMGRGASARPNDNRETRHAAREDRTHQARRHHRRRGRRRPLCHPSPAQARAEGARLRGRQRRRRHVVLEPLSGLPLRRREHGVLVFLLQRAAAGLEVARALRHAAGDPALYRSRRRPLRSQARYSARHAHPIGRLQQQDQPLDAQDRQGRDHHGAVLHHGDRQPVDAAHAEHPRPEELQGQVVPHRACGPTRASISAGCGSASSARARRACR